MGQWKARANCKDMDTNLFFDLYEADKKVQLRVDSICGSCPVEKECLEWAIKERLEGGVFGRRYIAQGTKKQTGPQKKFADIGL